MPCSRGIILCMGQGTNYWHESSGDMITLERGMSEGGLYRALTQGFRPMTSVTSTMGEAVRKLMRDLPVTQEFIDLITHATEGASGHRATQIAEKEVLFACFGPRSDMACNYARDNALNGGEVVTRIHNAIMDHFPEVAPLYPGARPVLVAFDAPRSSLNNMIPNQNAISELEKAGLPTDGIARQLSNTAVSLNSVEGIEIKSVTFAKMGPDGQWTFEGQPALTPQQSLAELQDKFNPEKSMSSKFAGPSASTRSWMDLPAGEKFLLVAQAEVGKFLSGKTTTADIGRHLGDVVERYTGVAPKEVADFCADMLTKPDLVKIGSVAEQGYGKAMKALQSIDAPAALQKAKEHLDKYGGITAVTAVATAVIAAAAPSPIRRAASVMKL